MREDATVEQENTAENPKLTKQQLLSAFKTDLKAADQMRSTQEGKVSAWNDQYEGKPYGNEQEGKSQIVSRDIKRQDEWQHASVKDPFVSNADIIRCHPVTFEDRAAAEQSELVLNYQFSRKFPRYNFMTDAVKLIYKEGTVVAKSSWMYEDTVEEVEMPTWGYNPATGEIIQTGVEIVEQIKVLVNQPHAEICRLQDIYLDPTALGDLAKAQFVIHRYESDLSTLTKSKKYKNLDKLLKNRKNEDENDYQKEDLTEFVFQDEARKKMVVYEYWGNFDVNRDGIAEPIVCTWVDDVILQLIENPLPGQQIPFDIVKHNPEPFKPYGEAAAELVGDLQKLSTAVKRGFIDNMANSNNGQKGIKNGALDPINEKRFLNGKNFKFNGGAGDFFEGSYNQIPGSAFDFLSMVNNETESMLGVKSFSGGISGQSLGSTATSARGALDAVSVRRMDIIRNIAENLVKPILRKWLAYNSEFLQEEEIVRITNDEFVTIKRDDLQGFVDIEMQVTTAEDNSNKAQELAFLLQTLGQGMDPEMQKLIMGQIAKLSKMPDLAKKLEEFQPQPDPYVEQMKQLELKHKEAEIMERISRATENEVDIRLKTAQAALAEARARDLQSGADLKDLDFTARAEGKDFQQEMARKDHDRATQLQKQEQGDDTKRRLKMADVLTKK